MLEYLPLAGKWLQVLVRRGPEIGPATLATYYALHTQWLPALLFAGAGFHFWRVRRAKAMACAPSSCG